MKELHTEIDINAPAARVWQILMDPSRYAEWNPFIHQLTGKIAEGEKIQVKLGESLDKSMTFNPIVLQVTPNRTFRWLGKLGFGGLFDGEHIFEIQELAPDRVHFIQREKFNGILIPFFNLDSTKQSFDAMNRALKQRAESATTVGAVAEQSK